MRYLEAFELEVQIKEVETEMYKNGHQLDRAVDPALGRRFHWHAGRIASKWYVRCKACKQSGIISRRNGEILGDAVKRRCVINLS